MLVRSTLLCFTVLSLATIRPTLAATSTHYAIPVGAFTAGGAAMASVAYRQFAALDPQQAPGISASGSQNQIAGLLGFLWGRLATVPDAPVLVQLVPGSAQLKVVFAPSVYNGGADVGYYRVTCTTAGAASVVVTGSVSPIVVTGLSKGLTYSCSVVAHNGVGDSPASTILSRLLRPVSILPIIEVILD